ncbi:putative lipoprotein, rSAM/lipoprotein system [Prevotella sp. ne3005]|uniref:radical SAM-associated putative lipoprotein n=1 Tax=Prevotella sp. ne3005 TaxID=1761887 RepID=UPI0008BED5C8|nr:radical SAM-associated putative lipoprotein [Prevotella sp. ne3005]SEM86093.1 putative lipoprotein, rSAM/lipoprotein system [Prevotella sp. ne3005]
MKVRFNRWYNAVLTALLSIIGYGCSSSDDPEYICMYGTPHADYQFMGTVTDESGSAVMGIKVSAKNVYRRYDSTLIETYGVDSTLTDSKGKYAVEGEAFLGEHILKLIVEDLDGEANGGNFMNDTIDIDFDNAKKVKEPDKDDYWSDGTFAITQDIKLKKK